MAFSEGDYVEHSESGQGVVTGVMKEPFEFPKPENQDETMEIDASSENPKYIVAFLEGGLGTAEEDELTGIGGLEGEGEDVTSPDEAVEKVADAELSAEQKEELVNIPGTDDPHIGFDGLPDDWTRKSVLQSWASLGGTWRSCYAKTLTAFGPRRAKKHCSAHKDEVLMTEEWRGKF